MTNFNPFNSGVPPPLPRIPQSSVGQLAIHKLHGMSGPRKVKLADKLVDFPSRDLQPLNDCTGLFLAKDWTVSDGSAAQPRSTPAADAATSTLQGLRAALNEDGYLYIKGFFPAGSVGAAGARVMGHLARMDTVLDPAFPPGSGILRERCGMGCLPFLEGKNELTQSPEVAGVIAGDALAGFMQQLLVSAVAAVPWGRIRPRMRLPRCRASQLSPWSTSGLGLVSSSCP